MRQRTTVAIALAIAASLAFVHGARADAVVGQPAPAFSLKGIDGKTHSLADSRGKIVVLEWVNYECPFVRKHYESGNMQALQKDLTKEGVVWLSVNSSAPGKQGNYPPEEWQKLIAEKGAAPTAVLLDPDGTVGRLYGAKTTPHMFVIDQKGVLEYAGAIDDKPSTNKADVQGSHNYVTAAVHEVSAGKPVSVASTTSYGCSVKY